MGTNLGSDELSITDYAHCLALHFAPIAFSQIELPNRWPVSVSGQEGG
jgi:hypothetical protein